MGRITVLGSLVSSTRGQYLFISKSCAFQGLPCQAQVSQWNSQLGLCLV